jgi:hypothetical protein
MSDAMLLVFLSIVLVGAAVALYAPRQGSSTNPPPVSAGAPEVGVGTVRTIAEVVTIEVESVSGKRFTGRLRGAGDPLLATLRPGVVLLVAFNPDTREQLSLPDDMVAVRGALDQMLVHKGPLTGEQLDLIRRGIKSRGVVTGMRPTGEAREDYREVEIDVMVRRPEGGQFPAHETALIPASSIEKVSPGSVIDTYYRRGDESTIAVCVPPS